MNNRARLCGAPTEAAGTTRQTASYPIPAKSPATRPAARTTGSADPMPNTSSARPTERSPDACKAPSTFSQTTRPGLISSTASSIDSHRADRVPSLIPARRPAVLKSWHGEPPQMTSTGSTWVQSTFVMSPRFGTPGHLTSASRHGPGSTSHTHETDVSPPSAMRTPSSSPPKPVNNDPIVFIVRPLQIRGGRRPFGCCR